MFGYRVTERELLLSVGGAAVVVAGGAYLLAWLADAVFGRPRSGGRYAPSRTSQVEDLLLRVGLLAVVVALAAGAVGGRVP